MAQNQQRDPFERNTQNQGFNQAANNQVNNKIKGYNLTKEEKSQIWNAVQTKDKGIAKEQQDYNNPKIWRERYKKALDSLRSQEQQNLNLNNDPKGLHRSSSHKLKQKAWDNVYLKSEQTKANLAKNADKKINNVLNKAREDGRGRKSELQQNFDQARDHNYNRDLDRR